MVSQREFSVVEKLVVPVSASLQGKAQAFTALPSLAQLQTGF